ncbi:hypothetical protein MGN70_011329 [Eutypa lata]|uniref:Putative idi-2 protein n=1 Tax=Eutypa lata (strain UCR-EL1) TaxID=1287681 RepID=M7TSL3_EUTLA|nr:putative idi-2 precursor protein [Eutypa lata UCREL1]KAI1247439.1 hypothetical protein MGN70_011329 [Eutypa lata]
MQFNVGLLFIATQAIGALAAAGSGSTANPHNILGKRDCWHGEKVGCTDGYCWKKCGNDESGTWCWTARNDGFGDWYTCSTADDCSDDQPCSQAVDGCDACGCSCN